MNGVILYSVCVLNLIGEGKGNTICSQRSCDSSKDCGT